MPEDRLILVEKTLEVPELRFRHFHVEACRRKNPPECASPPWWLTATAAVMSLACMKAAVSKLSNRIRYTENLFNH